MTEKMNFPINEDYEKVKDKHLVRLTQKRESLKLANARIKALDEKIKFHEQELKSIKMPFKVGDHQRCASLQAEIGRLNKRRKDAVMERSAINIGRTPEEIIKIFNQ